MGNSRPFDLAKPIQSKRETINFFDCSESFLHTHFVRGGLLNQVKIGGKIYFRTKEILQVAKGETETA